MTELERALAKSASDFQAAIDDCIGALTEDILGLFDSVCRDVVRGVFTGTGSAERAPARRVSPAPKPSKPLRRERAAVAPAAPTRPPASASPAPRRSSSLDDAVVAFVTEHPGCAVSALASALERTPREFILPMRRLIASGRLAKTGERRATRYFPFGGAPAVAAEEPIAEGPTRVELVDQQRASGRRARLVQLTPASRR